MVQFILIKVFRFDRTYVTFIPDQREQNLVCGIIVINWFLCHIGKITTPDI